MGTTKLTRKEILGDDPIHDVMISVIEGVRHRGKHVVLALAGILLLGLGIYLGLGYLEKRDTESQQILSRGIDFYHAQVDAAAPDDPYGKGPDPVFRTEEAKYQAATKEFSSVISRFGSSKVAVIAKYYVGLCQVRFGQKEEAIKTLEAVRDNTKDRSVGYLGKRVLAKLYAETGNYKAAQELLENMIKDLQCEIPKEELKLQLARNYLAMGKREDAVKALREAKENSSKSMFQSLLTQELSRLEESPALSLKDLKQTAVRPQ